MNFEVKAQTEMARSASAVCTIASKNYLSQVRIFAESVRKTNPGIPVYVLLVDRIEDAFDPRDELFILIPLEELDNIPNVPHFLFKYDQIELNTAAKPYFLEYLFNHFHLDQICYFDPDILVFSPLDPLWSLLDSHSLVLTPHITSPYEDDSHPGEIDINLAGIFNLGFLGISRSESNFQFLSWWKERLYRFCYMDPAHGMHVDQNWLNFAPAMHEKVFILRDAAFNIAYWNLHERGKRLQFKDKVLHIDQHPVAFFHFSGFNPRQRQLISRHQDRFTLQDFPNLKPLFDFYADLLEQNGFERIKKQHYAFGEFDNRVKIPRVARTLYASLSAEQRQKLGNPFMTEGPTSFISWLNEPSSFFGIKQTQLTHLHMEIHKTRSDLQSAFPDPLGRDREAFFNWIQSSAVHEFGLDPMFLNQASTTLKEQESRPSLFVRIQNKIRRVFLNARRRLKEALKPVIDPNNALFQKLITWEKKIFSESPQPVHGFHGSNTRIKLLGVNVAGYIQGEFGVAEAARASLKSLSSAGLPHVLNNIEVDLHRQADQTFVDFSAENPYPINLIHLNADQVPRVLPRKGIEYFRERHNIGYWFWELSQFPRTWLSSFDYFQEIWVASSFCQESIARISPLPVVKVPFPLLMDDEQTRPDREKFGFTKDTFVFGFFFDYLSFSERKNPLGLITAFQTAFGARTDVALVIKTINAQHVPEKAAQLQQAIRGMGNIKLMEGHFSRREMMSLISSLDSFVSLHRSEGFGISMAQAMYLRKPVIATGYSGNIEFMNLNNSFLVKYHLAELKETIGPYEKGNVWAEPDLDHAAELMNLVYSDRSRANMLALQGMHDVREQFSPQQTGKAMRERLTQIHSRLQK